MATAGYTCKGRSAGGGGGRGGHNRTTITVTSSISVGASWHGAADGSSATGQSVVLAEAEIAHGAVKAKDRGRGRGPPRAIARRSIGGPGRM